VVVVLRRRNTGRCQVLVALGGRGSTEGAEGRRAATAEGRGWVRAPTVEVPDPCAVRRIRVQPRAAVGKFHVKHGALRVESGKAARFPAYCACVSRETVAPSARETDQKANAPHVRMTGGAQRATFEAHPFLPTPAAAGTVRLEPTTHPGLSYGPAHRPHTARFLTRPNPKTPVAGVAEAHTRETGWPVPLVPQNRSGIAIRPRTSA